MCYVWSMQYKLPWIGQGGFRSSEQLFFSWANPHKVKAIMKQIFPTGWWRWLLWPIQVRACGHGRILGLIYVVCCSGHLCCSELVLTSHLHGTCSFTILEFPHGMVVKLVWQFDLRATTSHTETLSEILWKTTGFLFFFNITPVLWVIWLRCLTRQPFLQWGEELILNEAPYGIFKAIRTDTRLILEGCIEAFIP